jgi:hypothetical protein
VGNDYYRLKYCLLELITAADLKKEKGDLAWVDLKISITQVARADFYITVKIISK